ncbi:hypothetical protein ES5_16687 [Dietzia cinnamea P4]|nr:hypothetical protein ES5_16687 [Dietzia cinnamea P4]
MNNALTVDHLTDWSLLEWWLHYLGAIAVPALAIVLVVAAYRACRAIDRLSLPNPVEAAVGVGLVAGAFAVVFLGLNWHIDLLYGSLRHISSATGAVVAGLGTALLVAAASVVLALKLGTTRRRRLAVIALAAAIPAVFTLVHDGLYRDATASTRNTASVGMQSPTRTAAGAQPSRPSDAPMDVLPRSPPADQHALAPKGLKAS